MYGLSSRVWQRMRVAVVLLLLSVVRIPVCPETSLNNLFLIGVFILDQGLNNLQGSFFIFLADVNRSVTVNKRPARS